ncbi:response regulator transcription factor [Enterovibrio nigricans]|uniref:Phosphate regulon transcriptional regulatory protein PhoB n=1 Tax=Enterovibrio nigricans DSM 22720 TaxID=1121868 RepID=A0A1T4VLR8_9GAMM|nr:response regulator transcription factor [Enterovibrio nigricans]SKA65876.1 DNA-binding response regulator, OmpR family, contains REC and winged-helix (wHTH) domain [Enterovibrio nigricans DSM 22720]
MSQTVLVLEDDKDISELIALHLKVMGFDVLKGASIQEGFDILNRCVVDAIVLDRGLEDGDGVVLCQQLRRQQKGLPILILTAMDTETDMVEGFESGADDYLFKPFSVIEFQARIRALLRRVTHYQWSADAIGVSAFETVNAPSSMIFKHLEICQETHRVILDGLSVNLTPTEFSLLCCLAKRPDRVFSKDELLSRVWNTDYDGYRHTVCCAVNRLRSKLESRPNLPKYIHTVWGVGYKFRESAPMK